MAGAVSNCQPAVQLIDPTFVKLRVSEVSKSSGLSVKLVKKRVIELLLTKFSASICGGRSGGAVMTAQLTQVSAGCARATRASKRLKRATMGLRFISRVRQKVERFIRSG